MNANMKGFNGMNHDDFDSTTYSISFYMDKDNKLSYSFSGEYEDNTPWAEYLQRFIEFLEGAGFMGVRERVSVQDSPFLEGYWFGPVHEATNEDD